MVITAGCRVFAPVQAHGRTVRALKDNGLREPAPRLLPIPTGKGTRVCVHLAIYRLQSTLHAVQHHVIVALHTRT